MTTTSPALKRIFSTAESPAAYMRQYVDLMARLVESLDPDLTAELASLIEQVAEGRKTIFVMANGGSAAVASHFVNDMSVNSLVPGRRGIRVVSLSDNVESVTAVANDAGYENIFLFQLQCMLEPGDLVIGLSVSGNSENIVRAIDYANANDAHTVGICGFDGGRLSKAARTVMHFASTRDEYGPVEDMFSVVFHAVSGYLTQKRGRPLHH